MKFEDGGAAFPRPYSTDGTAEDGPESGMSLRDHIATEVLKESVNRLSGMTARERAKHAYRHADEMINVRKTM